LVGLRGESRWERGAHAETRRSEGDGRRGGGEGGDLNHGFHEWARMVSGVVRSGRDRRTPSWGSALLGAYWGAGKACGEL
jgi:hypothetical protein